MVEYAGLGQCHIEGCRIGEPVNKIETGNDGNLVSVPGRRRCIRIDDAEDLLKRAAAAGDVIYVETIRRGTPEISSGEDGVGVGRCWAWEEFLVASGFGREEGGLGSRRGQPFSREDADAQAVDAERVREDLRSRNAGTE